MASRGNPIVIGAGPAGLTAALSLTKRGERPRVYEATGNVGGLARTPSVDGWRVDPGGHRFFTKSEEVLNLWNELLPPAQWSSTRRHSAMLVDDRYVRYPLAGQELLTQLGLRRGMRGLGSLGWSRMRHGGESADAAASFAQWGTREFGRYWYQLFFAGYVRKTWLASPDDIASDWAAQRIRPIDWRPRKTRDAADDNLFRYPVLGPGQLWEAAASALVRAGVTPCLNSQVVKVRSEGGNWTVELQNGDVATGPAVFSSMPLHALVSALEPAPPKRIGAIAATLKHRALITVAVALRKRLDIPYHWVYLPGSAFHAGRIQNYGLWSKGLAPDGWAGTYLGFEYFVGPDGALLTADDEVLRRLAEEDLRALGVADSAVEHVMVVRSRHAYPVYDPTRDRSVALLRNFLRRNHPDLHPIGRNGMHRYDNQDHAMLSALRSVDRYFGEDVDPWQVNTDRRYHEVGLLRK